MVTLLSFPHSCKDMPTYLVSLNIRCFLCVCDFQEAKCFRTYQCPSRRAVSETKHFWRANHLGIRKKRGRCNGIITTHFHPSKAPPSSPQEVVRAMDSPSWIRFFFAGRAHFVRPRSYAFKNLLLDNACWCHNVLLNLLLFREIHINSSQARNVGNMYFR